MVARLRHLLLCVSVAVLLVPSCCNASQTAGARSLLPLTSASDDNTELPTNHTDQRVTTLAKEKENEIEFNQWARFQQVQEVAIDYAPPDSNPDPGEPSPSGD